LAQYQGLENGKGHQARSGGSVRFVRTSRATRPPSHANAAALDAGAGGR
jgi:hypothetical protein